MTQFGEWRQSAPFTFTVTFGDGSDITTGIGLAEAVTGETTQNIDSRPTYVQTIPNTFSLAERWVSSGVAAGDWVQPSAGAASYREWGAQAGKASVIPAITAALEVFNGSSPIVGKVAAGKAEWEFWGNDDGTLSDAGVTGTITLNLGWRRSATAVAMWPDSSTEESAFSPPSLDGASGLDIDFDVKRVDDWIGYVGSGGYSAVGTLYQGTTADTQSSSGHTITQGFQPLFTSAIDGLPTLVSFNWADLGGFSHGDAVNGYYSDVSTGTVDVPSSVFPQTSATNEWQPTRPIGVGLVVDPLTKSVSPPATHAWRVQVDLMVLGMTVNIKPPRYRTAGVRLRQFPRDDALGGQPRQGKASRSTQSTARQGWSNAYR